MENGWCSIAKMSIWKRTRKFRIYGSCRRKTANRGGSTQLPTMRNAHVFLPMANGSSGHRRQPIRRKSGCAILIRARAHSSVSRIRSRIFRPARMAQCGHGKNIVFVSAVYPDCKDDACNKQRDEELKKSKVKAKIFSRLFYRHWSAFTEFKRSHLFVVPADAGVAAVVSTAEPNAQALGTSASTTPRDLTPGDHDVPPFSLGGQDMYAISPDGHEVAYTSNVDEVEATSTNNEIFVVPISGGTPKKISTSPGADTTPLYSPDGKYVAWRSQARAGFEADK